MDPRVALSFSLLSAVVGCSAEVVDEADVHDPPPTQASLRLERSESVTGSLRTHVSAHFRRVHGALDQETAARVVTTPERFGETFGCNWRNADPSLPESAVDGSIELIDVGDIMVRSAGEARPLAARAFPDVGDIVSGVVYTSRDDTASLPAGTSYDFETSGSADVDRFVISAEAPEPPSNLEIGSSANMTSGEMTFDVTAAQAIPIRWDATELSTDRIGVTVSYGVGARGAGPHGASHIDCTFADTGSATIPASFNQLDVGAEFELVVHRVRRVVVAGTPHTIDDAIVDFDFAVSAHGTVSE